MNRTQLIMVGAVVIVIIGFIFAFLFGRKEDTISTAEGDLLMWGVFDDSEEINTLLNSFNASYPGIKITYQKKSIDSYEKDLINALAENRGPDIFYIHNTWLPKHLGKLSPMPEGYMTVNDFKDAFVDVAYEDFVLDGGVYALPLYVDTLALFYNKDIFNNAGIPNPPATWEGLVSATPSLTKKDATGNILQSAISVGTAKNVNRATDILSVMMLQSGTQMSDKEKGEALFDRDFSVGSIKYPSGQQSLEFYTNFANPKKQVYTWNNQIGYSIDAFLEGKTAMMINYSYQIENIRAKAPHLKYGISLMLQPKGASQVVNYANYWGLAVSKNSKFTDYAWGLANYLTQKDSAQTYLKLTGNPTARRDLVDVQRQENRDLGVFAQQSLSAYSWRQPDNIAVEKIFEKMIESTVSGIPSRNTITSAVEEFNLLIR